MSCMVHPCLMSSPILPSSNCTVTPSIAPRPFLKTPKSPPQIPGGADVVVEYQCVQRPLHMRASRALRHLYALWIGDIYTPAPSRINSAMKCMNSASESFESNANDSARSLPPRISVAERPSVE